MIALVITAVTLISASEGAVQCETGWTYGYDQCYRHYRDRTKTLTIAPARCRSLGGTLAYVRNVQVGKLVTNLAKKGGSGQVLVGGNENKKRGVWLWQDRTPVTGYNAWNGEKGRIASEPCLAIAPSNNKVGGVWNDISCKYHMDGGFGYICQKPTLSPPPFRWETVKLRKKGHKITTNPLMSQVADSLVVCMSLCGEQNGCISFNVCEKGQQLDCQLLDGDITDAVVVEETCDMYYVMQRYPDQFICENGQQLECQLLDVDITDAVVVEETCDMYYVMQRHPDVRK